MYMAILQPDWVAKILATIPRKPGSYDQTVPPTLQLHNSLVSNVTTTHAFCIHYSSMPAPQPREGGSGFTNLFVEYMFMHMHYLCSAI